MERRKTFIKLNLPCLYNKRNALLSLFLAVGKKWGTKGKNEHLLREPRSRAKRKKDKETRKHSLRKKEGKFHANDHL